jgi:hypothetical protein
MTAGASLNRRAPEIDAAWPLWRQSTHYSQ